MYIFIYRLQSENFEHDNYAETGGNCLWEAYAHFYAALVENEGENKDEFLSPSLFSKAIQALGSPKEMTQFFTSITRGVVKIVDVFGGANRIDIGQALSPV